MSNAVLSKDQAEWLSGSSSNSVWRPVLNLALVYTIICAALLIARHFHADADYVGAANANDNGMRLIEVRDFLAGQNWFDMHQYRLGPPGGTLMHWSRLVDLPIAALIAFFSLFMHQHAAEAAALTVWPSLTILPFLLGMDLCGERLAGRSGAHLTIAMSAFFVLFTHRFSPGAIDHDNVQMALMAIAAAMLLDRSFSASSFGIAGVMCGIAIAIGAETTPYVAVLCAAAALLWAWEGTAMTRAAQAFGLGFAATLTIAFYGTTPPALYTTVECDTLSVGFYVLGTIGGGLLFVAAASAVSRRSRALRFGALAACGIVIAAVMVTLTPQCLASPYAGLDPLLVRLWLDHVQEAQPLWSMVRSQPFTGFAFYLTPAFATVICLWRVLRGDRRQQHAILLALTVVALAITAVQVRGHFFSSLFATVPLAAFIIDLRKLHRARPHRLGLALGYVAVIVISLPSALMFLGAVAQVSTTGEAATGLADINACTSASDVATLANQPTGLVAGPSNMGVSILRFTDQRVLAAPYHRDAAGMTTELKIEMANPSDAHRLMRQAGVTIFAYCPGGAEASIMKKAAPDGLLNRIAEGDVPAYLEPIAGAKDGPRFYRVLRSSK